MNQSDEIQDDIIFSSWTLYQKVIRDNYMYHDEMYQALHHALPKDRALRILDLGCGDAHAISKALSDSNVVAYTGIDLSADALTHARANLNVLDCDVTLLEGDLLHELKNLDTSFDIIVAGYSIHYLALDDANILFKIVKEKLNKMAILYIMTR